MEEILKRLYQQTEELKKSIQFADMMHNRMQSDDVIKHLINKPIPNVKVKMYQEHHNEPHVHIDIGNRNHVASIGIQNQNILAGSIDRKYEKVILQWVEKNKIDLLNIWNNIQSGQSFDLSILN